MSSPVLDDLRRTLVTLVDIGRGALDRAREDAVIAEKITPISNRALDFYKDITSGRSAGDVDPGGDSHIPIFRPTHGREVTHQELLQKFGLRDELARLLLERTTELVNSPDIQSPSRLAFAVRGAVQDIFFGDLVGKHTEFLHGGWLGELKKELVENERSTPQLKRLAYWIGSDLAREKDVEYAQAKVRLTQMALAEIGDWDKQRRAVGLIKQAIQDQALLLGQQSHVTAAQFEEVMSQKATVAVERMPTHPDLFDPVEGRFRVLEAKPRTNADEFAADLTAKMGSARDKLAGGRSLFYGRMSSVDRNKVSVKIDANMGVDLTPTVTQGELVYAFLSDSFKRADRWGKDTWHRIIESNGAENFYVGRQNPDTLRDIGVFHYAMKAGLERVKAKSAEGSPEWSRADSLLGKIKEAQDSGYFFGSATHRIALGREPNEKMGAWLDRFQREVIDPAESAASHWVRLTDPDLDPPEKGGGFHKKDFADGVLELATYGGGAILAASDWEGTPTNPTAARVLLARATTPHVLPGVTGPGKSLIGMVLTGTRPADTVVNRAGGSIVDLFPVIATSTGLASMIARGGLAEVVKRVFDHGEGDAAVNADRDSFQAAWQRLEDQKGALSHFRGKIGEIQDFLRDNLKGPAEARMSEGDRFAYVRSHVRAALLEADDISNGFFDDYWEATRRGTRFAERAASLVGGAIPDNTRGAGIGPQIGLMQMTVAQPDEIWSLQEVKVDADPRKKGRSGPDAFPLDSIVEVPGGAALIGGTDARVVGMREAQLLGYPAEANHSLNGSFAFDRRNGGVSSLPIHVNLIEDARGR